MLTVDTSALVALIGKRQRGHAEVRDALQADGGPYVVPVSILAEIGYMVERRLGRAAVRAFVDNLQQGSFTLDCGDQDAPRMAALMDKYEDLSLGLADAAVVACSERNGGKILTIDRRDFLVVARGEPGLTILP